MVLVDLKFCMYGIGIRALNQLEHKCDVLSCLLPRSVHLACHHVFLPKSSCHCQGSHFKPMWIIWDKASYSLRSSSASIFTQISLFFSKSNNADTVGLLHTCFVYPLYIYTRMYVYILCKCGSEASLNFSYLCLCVFQRRVWRWENRKHEESDPVFGSCCLLP